MTRSEFIGFRADACTYLDVVMSAKSPCYAYYKCHIEGTDHECKKWGWCPLIDGGCENIEAKK